MTDILQDLSADNLIRAIEDNLANCIPLFSKIGEVKVNDPPGLKRVISDVPIPFFNSVVEAKLEPEQVHVAIQAVMADAKAHKVPVLWWVGPSSRPVDLPDQLTRSGFTLADDSPGMAVVLADLNEDLPTPKGLEIRPALDDNSWWAWCQAMSEGFGIPPDLEFFSTAWHDLLKVMDAEIASAYIAWLDGTPVATSLLLLGGGVAGIYGVATVPAARRKGIGAQITLHPLREARAKGYQAGVLEASEMGERVYRALGFQTYCRIRSYRYRP